MTVFFYHTETLYINNYILLFLSAPIHILLLYSFILYSSTNWFKIVASNRFYYVQ